MTASTDCATAPIAEDQAGDVLMTAVAAPSNAKPAGEDFVLIEPRKAAKKVILDDDEPLIDTTEALTLKSKKTERMQKRLQKKLKKTKVTSDTKNFLELPSELLQQVLSYLLPSDIFSLLRLNKATRDYVLDNESSTAKGIIDLRYWTLSRSLHLPLPLSAVDEEGQASLHTKVYQDRLVVHWKPYQHIRKFDDSKICTCNTCVQAWNVLNIVLDLHHWQGHLDRHDPIPMIARGKQPAWNVELLEKHASIVEKAVHSQLAYARILQFHLDSIVRTLSRTNKVGKREWVPKNKLYRFTDSDAQSGTDAFLERSGPPTHQPPYHRDNYYTVEVFVPNRIWAKDEQKWRYWKTHDLDMERIKRWYKPNAPATNPQLDAYMAGLAERLRA